MTLSLAHFRWYYHRLRVMPISEIFFRIGETLKNLFEKLTKLNWWPNIELENIPANFFYIDNIINFNYLKEYKIFDISFNPEDEINWHLDLQSGKEFPKIFSKKIDIRSDRYGNAKYVWELNRLQFLPSIAFRYKQTQDSKYLNLIQQIITSWIDDNPFLLGVNWYSNIEINIRLLNWFLCWQILDVEKLVNQNPIFKKFVGEKWIVSIYMHCAYSFSHPSKYSSANNHTIAEACGLFVASSFWPFEKSIKWQKYSKKILEKEIQRQHSSKGINKEEAAGYIQFVTDFLLLAYLVSQKVNNQFSNRYRTSLESIFEYIHNFVDESHNYPRYGDEDDALLFFLDLKTANQNYKSLLTSASILFEKPDYIYLDNKYDLKNAIYFRNNGRKSIANLPSVNIKPKSEFYPDEGHFFFKHSEHNNKIHFHFNAAPLGLKPMAAHGHADALSFSLFVNGTPVFVEPGTYCYHTEEKWRKYFIGTLAHNTIRVNKENQAISSGPTLWTTEYRVFILDFRSDDKSDFVKAYHTGYKRFGIIHTRSITFDKIQNRIFITDQIKNVSGTDCLFEIPFHIHPQVTVSSSERNEFALSSNGIEEIKMKIDKKLNPALISGQENPILGWYSPAFYQKEKTPVIFSQKSSSESFELNTEIIMGDNL